MKKYFAMILLAFAATCLLFCEKTKKYSKEFGSYEVSAEFVESERFSRNGKYFYLLPKDEKQKFPENISVEMGKNKYSIDDHHLFRQAIMRQLLWQTSGSEAQITGSGQFTVKNYVLYVFTITEPEWITTQYYIVGDRKFVLVHETAKTGSTEIDKIARQIVNSFVWKEDKK